MPEITIHPFTGGGVDNFDPDATRVGRAGERITWLSIWFGNLEVTIFGSPDELVEFADHVHEKVLTARDVKREKILADLDFQDRQLEVVDVDPDDWFEARGIETENYDPRYPYSSLRGEQ